MSGLLAHPQHSGSRQAMAFNFHSPQTAMRHAISNGNSDVTDTSAATTPTNHAAVYANAMYMPSNELSIQQQQQLQQLQLQHNQPQMAPSLSSSSATAKPAAPYAPVRRPKDRVKHSESENRRRQRLRVKFSALQDAAGIGGKKDRYTILGEAAERLHELEARLQQSETERNNLLANAANNPAAMTGGAAGALSVAPSLSTPLSHFQMLSSLAVCYISLDGRILDANQSFINLFAFNSTATAGASTTANSELTAVAAGNGLPATNALSVPDRSSSVSSAAGGIGAVNAQPCADLYSSSIFALTHHGELIHTLSILRNLLCGVMEVYECSKKCMDALGRPLDCHMTISAVQAPTPTANNKIVMFLCMFVPKSNHLNSTMPSSSNNNISKDNSSSTPIKDANASNSAIITNAVTNSGSHAATQPNSSATSPATAHRMLNPTVSESMQPGMLLQQQNQQMIQPQHLQPNQQPFGAPMHQQQPSQLMLAQQQQQQFGQPLTYPPAHSMSPAGQTRGLVGATTTLIPHTRSQNGAPFVPGSVQHHQMQQVPPPGAGAPLAALNSLSHVASSSARQMDMTDPAKSDDKLALDSQQVQPSHNSSLDPLQLQHSTSGALQTGLESFLSTPPSGGPSQSGGHPLLSSSSDSDLPNQHRRPSISGFLNASPAGSPA